VSRIEAYPRRRARADAGTPFELLLAEGTRARMVGLLGNRELDQGLGLLIPRCDSVHTVAMRFALDVAFVRWPPPSDDELEVLAVRADVRPGRMAGFKRRRAGLRRREVGALELAAGGAARLGIAAGEPIALDPPA